MSQESLDGEAVATPAQIQEVLSEIDLILEGADSMHYSPHALFKNRVHEGIKFNRWLKPTRVPTDEGFTEFLLASLDYKNADGSKSHTYIAFSEDYNLSLKRKVEQPPKLEIEARASEKKSFLGRLALRLGFNKPAETPALTRPEPEISEIKPTAEAVSSEYAGHLLTMLHKVSLVEY